MFKKILITAFVVFVIGTNTTNAMSFTSTALEELALYTGLQKLDTLRPGICNTYKYKQRTLTIRVNEWNEIEHIGLLLFHPELRKINPSPIYDFLERYLLAMNSVPQESEYGIKLRWANVYFAVGNAQTAMMIDTTATFTENHVDLHVYKTSWNIGRKKILEMSFDMNYQLLTGCDAIELESNLFSNLRRFKAKPLTKQNITFPNNATSFTLKGNYFISPLIRNDLYYKRQNTNDEWKLLWNKDIPSRTLSNLMLKPETDNVNVKIKLDKYGLRTDSVTTNYRAWWQLCINEGCSPYFGMKGKTGNIYHGTVFMVNRLGGYLHLLSINIPEYVIDKPDKYIANARIYCYIPLHNVSDKVLNLEEFKPIK
ncbi:MAG: hypothetical protein Q4D41_07315 [Prevotellaceae bacterium]|nr:hypothetical protein [Prevotellaceae bacterium]